MADSIWGKEKTWDEVDVRHARWATTSLRLELTVSMVGRGLLRSSAYMLMIMPGVQKPHCVPWALASSSYRRIIYKWGDAPV
jgi:uncharacterized protein YaaW (UPF0174 family)